MNRNKILMGISILSLIGIFVIFHSNINHFPFILIGVFFGIIAIVNCIRSFFCKHQDNNAYYLDFDSDSSESENDNRI